MWKSAWCVNTPEFAHAQRQRKKVEALFAELKNQIELRRLRLRRLQFFRKQFFLAAAAQNMKRLLRFRQGQKPTLATTPSRAWPAWRPTRDVRIAVVTSRLHS
jgi:hypothetical protein